VTSERGRLDECGIPSYGLLGGGLKGDLCLVSALTVKVVEKIKNDEGRGDVREGVGLGLQNKFGHLGN
jgi:uncharacterized membrane protein